MQYFCVPMPPAVRPTPFTTDGYGLFNLHTNLGACCKLSREGGEGGGEGVLGTNKSAQGLTS